MQKKKLIFLSIIFVLLATKQIYAKEIETINEKTFIEYVWGLL